jgi:hypothetical protein
MSEAILLRPLHASIEWAGTSFLITSLTDFQETGNIFENQFLFPSPVKLIFCGLSPIYKTGTILFTRIWSFKRVKNYSLLE